MADDDQDTVARCPKCGEPLIYVTSVAHPRSPAMQRTTFVCYPCNRTWSYALSPLMAAAYAIANADKGESPPLSPATGHAS